MSVAFRSHVPPARQKHANAIPAQVPCSGRVEHLARVLLNRHNFYGNVPIGLVVKRFVNLAKRPVTQQRTSLMAPGDSKPGHPSSSPFAQLVLESVFIVISRHLPGVQLRTICSSNYSNCSTFRKGMVSRRVRIFFAGDARRQGENIYFWVGSIFEMARPAL